MSTLTRSLKRPTGEHLPMGLWARRGLGDFTPAPIVVANQTFAFGSLTQAGAGGAKVVTGRSLLGATIDSQTDSGGLVTDHWQMASDGTITPTATGAGALSGPYTLTCTFTDSTGSDSATITLNTEAATYHVIDAAELTNALVVASGQTIKIRDGKVIEAPTEPTSSLDYYKIDAAPLSEVIIRSETPKTPAYSTSRGGLARLGRFQLVNTKNITLQYLEIHDEYGLAMDHTTTDGSEEIAFLIRWAGDNHNVKILNCEIHASVTAKDANGHFNLEAFGSTLGANNFTIEGNHFHDLRAVGQVDGAEDGRASSFQYNLAEELYTTGPKFLSPSNLTCRWNVVRNIFANANDPAGEHFSYYAISNGAAQTNLIFEANVGYTNYDRGIPAGIKLDDLSGAGVFYKNSSISYNFLMCDINHSILFEQGQDCKARYNTIVGRPWLSPRPAGSEEPSVLLAPSSEYNLVDGNIAHRIYESTSTGIGDGSGTPGPGNTLTANHALGAVSSTDYAGTFVGPDFTALAANPIEQFAPLVGGLAAGLGSQAAVTWPANFLDDPTAGTITEPALPAEHQWSTDTAYTQNLVDFDGTNDYLAKTISSGIADGTDGTLSIWLDLDAADGADAHILNLIADRVLLSRVGASNALYFILNDAAGTGLVRAEAPTTTTAASGLTHLLMSWSLGATPVFQMCLNGQVVTPTFAAGPTAGTIDYTRESNESWIGRRYTSNYDGRMGDLWFSASTYLDLSVEANRRKFIDASGNPVDLGANGSNPTGAQPHIFFGGSMLAADWNAGNGLGTIQGWTMTGAVTDV